MHMRFHAHYRSRFDMLDVQIMPHLKTGLIEKDVALHGHVQDPSLRYCKLRECADAHGNIFDLFGSSRRVLRNAAGY